MNQKLNRIVRIGWITGLAFFAGGCGPGAGIFDGTYVGTAHYDASMINANGDLCRGTKDAVSTAMVTTPNDVEQAAEPNAAIALVLSSECRVLFSYGVADPNSNESSAHASSGQIARAIAGTHCFVNSSHGLVDVEIHSGTATLTQAGVLNVSLESGLVTMDSAAPSSGQIAIRYEGTVRADEPTATDSTDHTGDDVLTVLEVVGEVLGALGDALG